MFSQFAKAAALPVSVDQEEGRGCVGNKGIKNYRDCVRMTSLWLDAGSLQSSNRGCSVITVDSTEVPCRVALGVLNLLSLSSCESV